MIKHFCDWCGKEIGGPFVENIHIYQRVCNNEILNDKVLKGEYHIHCIDDAISKELEK